MNEGSVFYRKVTNNGGSYQIVLTQLLRDIKIVKVTVLKRDYTGFTVRFDDAG